MELQDDRFNGSMSNQARFGSAIANIGDINKDSYNGKTFTVSDDSLVETNRRTDVQAIRYI